MSVSTSQQHNNNNSWNDQPEIARTMTPTLLQPVVDIIFIKNKTFLAIRKDGTCTLEPQSQIWRQGKKSMDGLEVISSSWRPLSENKSVLALGFKTHVILCDFPLDKQEQCIERTIDLKFPPTSLTWSPKGRVLYCASTNSCFVVTIDAAFGTIDSTSIFRPVGFRNNVKSAAWSSANRLYVSGTDAPIFRVFDETTQIFETWVCKKPNMFGGWSDDGHKFLTGSSADGLLVVDMQTKSQWLVVNPDELKLAAVANKCDPENFTIKQLLWESKSNQVIVVVFDSPCNGAALFNCSKIGVIMFASYAGSIKSSSFSQSGSIVPIRASFSLANKGELAVAFSDGSVQIWQQNRIK
jgi:WD40 repeat protein